MSENREVQKRPEYSINSISTKSELAKRGLREFGLLKDKKHFTIIYVCQFCGRLINYALTPCIFCGSYPKTNRETLMTEALSSNNLSFPDLLVISKAVKNHEDLKLIISNLRVLMDEELRKNELAKTPEEQTLVIRVKEKLFCDDDWLKETAAIYLTNSHVTCKKCTHPILVATHPCLNCEELAEQQGEDLRHLFNDLTLGEKWIVALNSFLLYIENGLDFSERENIEELVFVSVSIINRLIEKNELPDSVLWEYWKDLAKRTQRFGNSEKKMWVEIEGDIAEANIDEDAERNESDELNLIILCSNLSFLLRQSI